MIRRQFRDTFSTNGIPNQTQSPLGRTRFHAVSCIVMIGSCAVCICRDWLIINCLRWLWFLVLDRFLWRNNDQLCVM